MEADQGEAVNFRDGSITEADVSREIGNILLEEVGFRGARRNLQGLGVTVRLLAVLAAARRKSGKVSIRYVR